MKKIFLIALIGLILFSGCFSNSSNFSDNIYSVTYVEQNQEKLIGKEITVEATVIYGASICSKDKVCKMPLKLADTRYGNARFKVSEEFQGKEVACYKEAGNEFKITCSPLELDKNYKVIGILRKDSKGSIFLEMKEFEPM
jgi:hypothetical protein